MTEKAIFAAGCFWGVEADFRRRPGVVGTAAGYSGGTVDDPGYEAVCSGATGHAEVVEVEFDPARVSYEQLLELFWELHDPTQRDRQGMDVGSQYRSAIFFHGPAQESAARAAKAALDASGRWPEPVVTEIAPAGRFWPAEEHHQRYFEKQMQSRYRV